MNSHEICVVHHHWRFFSYRLTKQIWRLPSFAPIYQSKHKSYINSEDCIAMFKVKVHVYVNLQTSDFNLMGLQNTFRNLSLLVKWSGKIGFVPNFFAIFDRLKEQIWRQQLVFYQVWISLKFQESNISKYQFICFLKAPIF